MRTRLPLLATVTALAVVAAACSRDTAPATSFPPSGRDRPPAGIFASNLVPFDACEGFLDYVISHGVELVGPYGLPGAGFFPFAVERAVADDAAQEGGAIGAGGNSGTNIQVAGVDEPDLVKSDSGRIVLLSEGQLTVVDVSGDQPREAGRLRLQLPADSLFLHGDTVLLFGSAWPAVPQPLTDGGLPAPSTPTVQVTEVDISGEPRVVRTLSIDGRFVAARMVGSSVRLVLSSPPLGFEWSYPAGSGLRAEREATAANREIVRRSTPENWIPYMVLTDAEGAVEAEGTLFDCRRASRPPEFSGLDMLSVVTIDLESGLRVVDATGVLASGETVYASATSLYVATQRWEALPVEPASLESSEPPEVETRIHQFDISDPRSTRYLASGRVDGYLLNQFSMDESGGHLRVASTTSPLWWGGDAQSESQVTVLTRQGSQLVEVGSVGGLGKTERIYSVRFMGDTAYVVTFRQTDPLYTIDLSDPTRPRVAGELKIPGYSAYLHPVGEGLLLGVGQDADEEGRVKGTQVSLFDVRQAANPSRLAQVTLEQGSTSQVELDHHAFLYWADTGLVMVPVQQWWWEEQEGKESVFFGAVALRVDPAGGLTELGRLTHPGGGDGEWDYRAQILRSLVVGGRLFTVSAKGVLQSDLATLAEQAWLEL